MDFPLSSFSYDFAPPIFSASVRTVVNSKVIQCIVFIQSVSQQIFTEALCAKHCAKCQGIHAGTSSLLSRNLHIREGG